VLNNDGTKLLLEGKKLLEVWALPNLDKAATITSDDEDQFTAFTAGGDALIAAGNNSTNPADIRPTRIWKIATDKGMFSGRSLTGSTQYDVLAPQHATPLTVLGKPDDARGLGVAGAATAPGGNGIDVIDVEAGRILHALAVPDFSSPTTASADGRRLLVLTATSKQVWDTVNGTLLMEVKNDPINFDQPLSQTLDLAPDAYAFNDSGDRLCIISEKNGQLQVTLFDLDGRKKIASATTKIDGLSGHTFIPDASFSPDGGRITVVLGSSLDDWARILVFDGQSGSLKRDLGSPDANEEVFFSPKKTWFLFVSKDTDNNKDTNNIIGARLVNSDTGLVTKLQLPAAPEGTYGAFFSPDEQKFIVTSGATAGIWDAATGSLLKSCPIGAGSDTLKSAAFGPGASIALGTTTGAVYLCDAASGNVRKLPDVSSGEVNALAFSADGHWLAASGTTTRIFDDVDDDPALVASTPDAGTQLIFAPDNRYLVLKNTSGGTIIHRLFPSAAAADLVAYARSALPRCLTPVERRQYHLVAEPPLWCVAMAKWPYNTAEWGKWLEARQAGKPIAMPADPRFAVH
jgi:WD40 repeat protein